MLLCQSLVQNSSACGKPLLPLMYNMRQGSLPFSKPGDTKAPKISIHPRACYIFYWGDRKTLANVAVFNEQDSKLFIFIIPLWLNNGLGASRSFELQEAVVVLDPQYTEKRPPWPGPANETSKLECEWIVWYVGFLKAHLLKITSPSHELITIIEANRVLNPG